jgi:cyclopropane-fatty-acyl-phospholipid synthase
VTVFAIVDSFNLMLKWFRAILPILFSFFCLDAFGSTCGDLAKRSNPEIAVREILDNAAITTDGTGSANIVVNDPGFFRRFLSDPELQIGETYMDGMWDSNTIDQVAANFMSTEMQKGRFGQVKPMWRTPGLLLRALFNDRYRYYRDLLTNRQTRSRSTTVATEHYDVGNELYRRMLDPTLTYTSGIWAHGYTLEDAQNAKYDLIARKLGLKVGEHILDIGSGFGGFARFAAKHYGVKVTGITISVEQLKAARALSADYPGVNFVFSDYRDLPYRFPPGTFDHVVSIEMIEAVGSKNLEEYFQSAFAVLKPGGRFMIQAIAGRHDVVNSNPWFSKYIFQDGVAPSLNQVDAAAKSSFGAPADRHNITADYDKTLLTWHDNFTRAWPDLKDQYGDRFKRMWDFYLLSVAGAFRVNYIGLDQSVFIKGKHQGIIPVRTLPTRAQLDGMRATDNQIEETALRIGALEDNQLKLQALLAPRPAKIQIPLPKNTRIAIIGAGPGGLSSARKLKDLGFTNVVVFEKNEAGGKSHTVEFDGRPHDMGATMGTKLMYRKVEKFADEAGEATVPFPKEVYYDLKTGKLSPPASFFDNAKFIFQGLLYLIQYARVGGLKSRGLEIPPMELADSWSVVMKRLGLDTFGGGMDPYITGYGYTAGPQTPAVYPMRMLGPEAIFGAAFSPLIMWENGTQPIWKHLARQLNVRTQTEVNHIERSMNQVKIYLDGQMEPETFDKVIMAIDPLETLKILDATPEEKSLFSQVKHTPYATFAARVEGFAEGRAEVGYIKENMSLDREGHPMAWIKRYADDNIFIFHLFAPRTISDEQIMANITDDMQRLGAGRITLVDSRRWPFFPHVDTTAMREGHFYELVWRQQGELNTTFVNEALAMSTMPNASELGVKVAERLAAGEY